VDGRRAVDCVSWPEVTWLSDQGEDPNELVNLAESRPDQLAAMQQALKQCLLKVGAPSEQLERLGLDLLRDIPC